MSARRNDRTPPSGAGGRCWGAMLMFHSTPTKYVEAILREGLQPDGEHGVHLALDGGLEPLIASLHCDDLVSTFEVDTGGLKLVEGYDGEETRRYLGTIEPSRLKLLGSYRYVKLPVRIGADGLRYVGHRLDPVS